MKTQSIIAFSIFFSVGTLAADLPAPAGKTADAVGPGSAKKSASPPATAKPESANTPRNEYLETLRRDVARKKQECMLAFGYEPFCTCISQNTPETTTFELYIKTTTASPEVMTVVLDGAQPDLISTIEKIRAARDSCVTSSLPTQKR